MKIFRLFATLIALVAVPALAGLAVMALWNSIIAAVCGFAAITFFQGVGIFILGQILSSGFIIAMLFGFGSLHAVMHPRGSWKNHWHAMSDDERREFIRRRREMFGFRKTPVNGEDVAE
ncbi:MAG: hypothetical protein K2L59_02760 [Muribaculaceae bacterium]|nr:hypothetical protein [Muribaculaceae bacterium]